MKVKSLSHDQLFVTPWTVAYQAPPSKGFSKQEYWNGLPFPSPGESSQTRDQICVSCTDRQILDHWEPRKQNIKQKQYGNKFNKRLLNNGPYQKILKYIYILKKYCCCCLVTKLCLTLCNPMDCSMPVFPVLHYLPEFAQTHVHWPLGWWCYLTISSSVTYEKIWGQ